MSNRSRSQGARDVKKDVLIGKPVEPGLGTRESGRMVGDDGPEQEKEETHTQRSEPSARSFK